MATSPKPKDPERLYYPKEITEDIGLGVHAINALKRQGCPFYGTRTTIRWVRAFIERKAQPPTGDIEKRIDDLRRELARLEGS